MQLFEMRERCVYAMNPPFLFFQGIYYKEPTVTGLYMGWSWLSRIKFSCQSPEEANMLDI